MIIAEALAKDVDTSFRNLFNKLEKKAKEHLVGDLTWKGIDFTKIRPMAIERCKTQQEFEKIFKKDKNACLVYFVPVGQKTRVAAIKHHTDGEGKDIYYLSYPGYYKHTDLSRISDTMVINRLYRNFGCDKKQVEENVAVFLITAKPEQLATIVDLRSKRYNTMNYLAQIGQMRTGDGNKNNRGATAPDYRDKSGYDTNTKIRDRKLDHHYYEKDNIEQRAKDLIKNTMDKLEQIVKKRDFEALDKFAQAYVGGSFSKSDLYKKIDDLVSGKADKDEFLKSGDVKRLSRDMKDLEDAIKD